MIKAFRKNYKRITAFLLSLILTCMNIGSNLHVAFAVGEDEEALFLVDGAELKQAIQDACESGEVFDFASLNLKAKSKTLKNSYERLLGTTEGAVYELDVPVDDSYAPDGTSVQVFYNAASEDVAFLFINESDMVVTFRANVDGYETNRVTVNPNPANIENGETAAYVEDYSNTIMIDDTPKPLGAQLIGTEGNTETAESEPEQTAEAEVLDGSESLEASTEAEETEEMTQEAPARDETAEGLQTEETENTEAAAAEDETGENVQEADAASEEAAEEVVIETEAAEEKAEEEIIFDSKVSVELESETGELVGMSRHPVYRVGTTEETTGEAVVILEEPEETTEASQEEIKEESEEESKEEEPEELKETTAGSEEETTEAAAAVDGTTEESTEVTVEESMEETVSEEGKTTEVESSAEDTAKETLPGAEMKDEVLAEEKEAQEDGQMLINDVNADEEMAVNVLGDLDGKPYNTVTIWDSANARAYKVSVEDLEGIEAFGSYAVDYSVDPLGTAEVVGPSYIAQGEDLYFGVKPQVGYVIEQVLANGAEVELVEETDLASISDATKSNADMEDAEEGTVFYVVPEVLEDQEIEVILAEEVLGSHPAFYQAKTVNGVMVTVEAEEDILPAGTELEVQEVTDQIETAVKEKVESQNEETGVNVTSVIAYDINLTLNGKKLNSNWGDSNQITVNFSGDRIKALSEESDELQVVSVDTPTRTVEAALGGVEEVPVVDNVTTDDIEVNTEGREAINVSGDASVAAVAFATSFANVQAVYGAKGAVQQPLDETGDLPFIRVRKIFNFKEGELPESGIDNAFGDYAIELRDSSNEIVSTLTLENGQKETTGNSYFWEVPNLYDTKYYVEEVNAALLEYNLSTVPENIDNNFVEVEVKQASFNGANFVKYPNGCENNINPGEVGFSDFKAFCISTTTGEFYVWTKDSLSISERQVVVDSIYEAGGRFNDIRNEYIYTKNNPEHPTVFFYSDKYNEDTLSQTGVDIRGTLVRYDKESKTIQMSAPKQWNMIALGDYKKESALGAGIEITNNYSKRSASFALMKKLQGEGKPISGSIVFDLYKEGDINTVSGVPTNSAIKTVTFNPEDFSAMTGEKGFVSNVKLFDGLTIGNYYLKETSTFPGYVGMSKLVKITVCYDEESGQMVCSAPDESDNWELQTIDGENLGLLTVINYTSIEFPVTGGPGLGLIKEFGWMLLLLAAAMAGIEVGFYGRRRKKA